MSAQTPQNHEQMADLLPLYLNNSLDTVNARQVRAHLATCASCQIEYATWLALQGASKQVYYETPLPSAQVMEQVWARLDAPVKQHAQRGPLERTLHHLWLVFRAQISLIHKSIWLVSALVCLLGLSLSLIMATRTHAQAQFAADLLVLFIVVAGASGSAFIYGASVDPGFELAITTPTSLRFVMLCRMLLVLGYNFLLGLLASAVFASVYGGGLWECIQLWLGPLLFLSSLCLAISLFISSTFALLCTIVIEALQIAPARFSLLVNLPLPELNLNSTSPALFIAALLLIVLAVIFVPRQPRPATL